MMPAPSNGVRSAADFAEAGDLRIMTLNIDGLDGKMFKLIEWMLLNDVDVFAMQETKLKFTSHLSVKDTC